MEAHSRNRRTQNEAPFLAQEEGSPTVDSHESPVILVRSKSRMGLRGGGASLAFFMASSKFLRKDVFPCWFLGTRNRKLVFELAILFSKNF